MSSQDALLQQALQQHSTGNLQQAEKMYSQVLAAEPANGDARNFLGVLYHQVGDSQRGIELISQAIQNFPERFAYQINLGVVFEDLGRLPEAKEAYSKALSISPDNPLILFNLGNVYSKLGSYDEAVDAFLRIVDNQSDHAAAFFGLGNCYVALAGKAEGKRAYKVMLSQALVAFQKCISSDPSHAIAHLHLGNVSMMLNDMDNAQRYFEQAIALDPSLIEGYSSLAKLYNKQGKKKEAILFYQKALALNPDDAQANHMLSALKGEKIAAASGQYVADLFDDYAERFEQHLIDELQYQVPEMLRTTLNSIRQGDEMYQNGMDLGCGSGLSGLVFRDITRSLDGIDLSPKMIDKAKAKNIYDGLAVGSISDIRTREKQFDLLIAADVFVYIGDLEEVFATVALKAVKGAHFLFSVESCEGDSFVLRQSGRFAHSQQYIEKLAEEHGFHVRLHKTAPLRKESDNWLQGEIYILEKK